MSYLISQIWLCLVITAIIAGITGWLLRGSREKKKLQDMDHQWQEQYNSVENARRGYANQVENFSMVEKKNNELELQVSLQKQSFEKAIQHLKGKVEMTNSKQMEVLAQKDEELIVNLTQFDEEINILKEEKKQYSQHFSQLNTANEEQLAANEEQLKSFADQSAALSTALHINKADVVSLEEQLLATKKELDKEKHLKEQLLEDFSITEKNLTEQLAAKEKELSQAITEKKASKDSLAKALDKAEKSIETKFQNIKSNTTSNKPSSQTQSSAYKSEVGNDFSAKEKNLTEPLAGEDELSTQSGLEKETTKESLGKTFNTAGKSIGTKFQNIKSKITSSKPFSQTQSPAHETGKEEVSSQATLEKEAAKEFSSQTQNPAHENKISSDMKNMFTATGIAPFAKTGLKKIRKWF